MSDIFISYANEDRPWAEMLAQALRRKGWSTFWDRTIPFGMTWRQVIGRELADARCVMVLWSHTSIESIWVQEEADDGQRRAVLIPVLIEGVLPPIGFRSIQAADLSDWDGATETSVFQRLVSDIARLIGPPPEEAREEERKRAAAEREAEQAAQRQAAEAAERQRKAEEERKEAEASRKAEEERKRVEADEKRKAAEEKRKADEEKRKRAEVDAKRKAEEEAKRKAEDTRLAERIDAERKAEEGEPKQTEARMSDERRLWIIVAATVVLFVAGTWGVYQYNAQMAEQQRPVEAGRVAVDEQRRTTAEEAFRKAEEEANRQAVQEARRVKEAAIRRERVQEVQRLLAELGYAPGLADGVEGPATERAIALFKRKTGLSGDPVVDEALLVAVRDAVRGSASAETARSRKPGKSFSDCTECPEMDVVPAGSFLMGSSDGDKAAEQDEKPQHPVSISRPFAVGRYEVTRAEYASFVKATGRAYGDGCYFWTGSEWKKDAAGSWRDPGFKQTNRDPVACVNWHDAKAYVDWLRKETGKSYRLLTEAESEYAARAGTSTRYSFGDEISAKDANFSRHLDQTSAVGSYPANPWNLHDMHGNVWEWVEDCWNGSYKGAPSDGGAWLDGDCSRRVLRGGSWSSNPGDLRSAVRGRDGTGVRVNYFGFRVARTLP